MKQQRSHPKWWQIKLLVPLMLGLFVLDKKYLALSTLGHQFVQAATVLIIYGSMTYWLYINQAAVRDASDQAGPWQQMEGLEPDRQPMLPKEVGQNERVAADRSDHTAVPSPGQTASIDMRTRNGASVRAWLN